MHEAVLETLMLTGLQPETVGKRLVGRMEGFWAARVGSCRVLYTIEPNARTSRVVVRAIRHRAVAYGPRR